ncbi:hypothetical protein [Butyrivibrio proteoclasticus]|nr:hypothetical protein [Butyrivibrio proteoclasticus]
MGTGYRFKCKECGHEYSILLGIGFLYPKVYRDTLKKIADGKYGEEF